MFKVDNNFDYKICQNNYRSQTAAFVFNREVLSRYLACHDSLKKAMKKDVYYYLSHTAFDFEYCIENDCSTHKILTYFYECPADIRFLDLIDYTRAHHYAIRQSSADIELLIDCSLIPLFRTLTIWQNGELCLAKPKTKPHKFSTAVDDTILNKYQAPQITIFDRKTARFNECDLTKREIYTIKVNVEDVTHEIRIPVIEIIKFFYLDDPVWNHNLFAGQYMDEESVNRYLIDVKRSKIGYRGCEIKLRNRHLAKLLHMSASKMYLIREFKHNIYRLSKVVQVNNINSEVDHPTKYRIGLPFGVNHDSPNSFRLDYIGIKKVTNSNSVTHYVEQIVTARYHLPCSYVEALI